MVANHAIRAITILKGLDFIILCFPFGAAAGPALYSQVSKSIFDLTNDLLEDETWDPDTLHLPHYTSFAKPEIWKDKESFGHAKHLAVPVPPRTMACDGYIDDAIYIAVDINDNARRIQNTSPLAIHTIF